MRKILALTLMIAILGLTGCVIDLNDGLNISVDDQNISIDINSGEAMEIGKMNTYKSEFDFEGQEKLDVKIDLNAVDIDIRKNDDKLFKGVVTSNIKNYDPMIELDEDTLYIKQKSSFRSLRKINNDWDIEITDKIPVTLDINLNASKNDFDLTGLKIEEIEMFLNATDTEVQFDKKNEADLSNISLDVNAGDVEIVGLDYAAPQEIEVKVNAGNVTLEFGNNISRNIEITLQGNAAKTTIDLPDNVGISIDKRTNLANLDINNALFEKDDDIYKSENYETAEYKVDITIRGSLYDVEIE